MSWEKPFSSVPYRTILSRFLLLASFSLLFADCFIPSSCRPFRKTRCGGNAYNQFGLHRRQAKTKKSRYGDSSPVGSILDFAFKAGGLGSNKSSKNIVQSGIEGALVLTDTKRRNQFKRGLNQQFPWIPPGVLESCVDVLSDSFSNVAPADLKKALQPGGLEKVRPKLESTVVRNLQDQPIIQNLPLSEKDRRDLLVFMVSTSLDFFFKDLQSALEESSLKLSMIDRERLEIQKFMSFRQRMCYRIRYYPLPTIGMGLLCAWTLYLSYQQYKHTALVSGIVAVCHHAYTTVTTLIGNITTILIKASGKTTGMKRKTVAKAWRR